MEIWKDIKGYEGLYQVSNYGRVKSIGRHTKWKNSTRFIRERMLVFGDDGFGYMQAHLCKDGKEKICKVHRLVSLIRGYLLKLTIKTKIEGIIMPITLNGVIVLTI